ncbi:MAG: hypothetical protein EXS63_08045 [Candidatus Omnitrophica bacterium]|nr:hypothetical protein [Candidatus Omnitrophota bacterium]
MKKNRNDDEKFLVIARSPAGRRGNPTVTVIVRQRTDPSFGGRVPRPGGDLPRRQAGAAIRQSDKNR